MKPLRVLASALAIAFVALGAGAGAGEPVPAGEWLTQDGEARIRVTSCGEALCGAVSWQKDDDKPRTDVNNPDPAKRSRPIIGSQVLLGLKPDGPRRWSGSLYNAENGRTYSGHVDIVDANHLKLTGCVLGGLICESQTWTRYR